MCRLLCSLRRGVSSTLGELGKDMFTLQEKLCAAFRRKVEEEPVRGDGYGSKRLTAEFRSDFKAALFVAVATGTARMLREAGLPF